MVKWGEIKKIKEGSSTQFQMDISVYVLITNKRLKYSKIVKYYLGGDNIKKPRIILGISIVLVLYLETMHGN